MAQKQAFLHIILQLWKFLANQCVNLTLKIFLIKIRTVYLLLHMAGSTTCLL